MGFRFRSPRIFRGVRRVVGGIIDGITGRGTRKAMAEAAEREARMAEEERRRAKEEMEMARTNQKYQDRIAGERQDMASRMAERSESFGPASNTAGNLSKSDKIDWGKLLSEDDQHSMNGKQVLSEEEEAILRRMVQENVKK